MLVDGHTRWNAIGFGFGELATRLPEVVDVAYQVESDTYRGGETLRLKVRGIRPAIGRG